MTFDDEPTVDFESIPSGEEAWLENERNGNGHVAPEAARAIVASAFPTLGAFRTTHEATSESLLGPATGTILPADGTLLMYGDGGAGKTTLTIDGVFNLAAGRPWLGLETPRPVRSVVIENEGPRGMFRRRLDEKAEAFGHDVDDAIRVFEEPWSQFTLKDADLRYQLAELVDGENLDLVVLGPIATVGMVGGGTPDEVSVFEGYVRAFRDLVSRPVALWLIHHENKAGDISGAWERVPDTLVHVQAVGNGHTKVVWRKARWSSELHGTTVDLTWSEGRSFAVVEEVIRDMYADVLEAFRHADAWRTYKEVAKLSSIRETEAKSVLAELTRRGDLMFEKGPNGRAKQANCWRLAGLRLVDPTLDPLEL